MGQYMPWLAEAARLTGYPVTEMRGWRGHNHGPMAEHIYGVVCHHTAGAEPPRSSDFPTIGVVRDGRAGLPGPLAQLGLGFSGRIYVISDGLAYHAGTGSWRGVAGNSRMIGIEAEDSGDGDWTAEQLDAYPRLVAALHTYLGTDAGWCCGHKEWTPRKIDPAGIHMPDFRGGVAHYLANPHLIRRGQEDDMFTDADRKLLQRVHHEATLFLLNRRAPGNDKERDTVLGFAASAEGRAARIERYTLRLGEVLDGLAATLADRDGIDPEVIRTAVKAGATEAITDVVLPELRTVVTEVLGADNETQADAIVDALATRLHGQEQT